MSLQKPLPQEYASYYEPYIQALPEGDILAYLASQTEEFEALKNLDDQKGNYRYAPEKWSVKELLGHVNDSERIMSYRLLRIARGDKTPLSGFEENDYVLHAGSERLAVDELVNEFAVVRASTLALARQLDDAAWLRTGVANGFPASARAVLYTIAGHTAHHLRILRERYEV
ncbi:DinB family protein [Paenibacillus sp. J22TS3]|uniref:DinB family protein n=1 Tax=Paenibacillus sp. J22TS3 TaxID=2807192 RepID=UPI001B20C6E0|nr:DinB family protein [Paenibacillus sp. J22TS3]GIP20407.1 hypothetical protein J22TS3_06820 [Paenibacillus sp. J22TS3]